MSRALHIHHPRRRTRVRVYDDDIRKLLLVRAHGRRLVQELRNGWEDGIINGFSTTSAPVHGREPPPAMGLTDYADYHRLPRGPFEPLIVSALEQPKDPEPTCIGSLWGKPIIVSEGGW